MPTVKGRKFAYTAKGKKAAEAYRKEMAKKKVTKKKKK